MKPRYTLISLLALQLASLPCNADLAFSTNFEGSEGYTDGGIDNSNQTGAPFFNETNVGGMYLPLSTGPDFGTLRRTPTTGDQVIHVSGEGSAYAPGSTWTASMDFTFEGLPNTAPGGDVFLPSLGFSTSSAAISNQMLAGIQKRAVATESYRLYITGGGFGFDDFNYAGVGDETGDDNDLTDMLRLQVSLTKSANADEFDLLATLSNLDTVTTVATASATMTRAAAYSSDLFGYINSGAVNESNNFDLFNVDAFSYSATAIPEPSAFSMLLSGMLVLGLGLRRKASASKG